MSEKTENTTKSLKKEETQTSNNKKVENKETTKTTNKEDEEGPTFRRIKIQDLPPSVTRSHIEELCSKFGRIVDIEMKRSYGFITSYVTFYRSVDAEFALYRLLDMTYMQTKIKAYPAELTQEEIEQRKEDAKERERKRLEGRDKKKKIVKQPKGSLRHLAPINKPTTGNNQRNQKVNNNTSKGNNQNENTQVNQTQGQQRKNSKSGGNGQGYRGQGQRQNQGTQKNRGYQNRNNGQGNRQGQKNQNQKQKYRVKNTQNNNETEEIDETLNQNDEQQKNDELIYELSVKNINTGKQLISYMISEKDVRYYFPDEDFSF